MPYYVDKLRLTTHNLTNQLFTLISKVLQEGDDLKGTRSTSHGWTISRMPLLLLAVVLAAAFALRLLHLYGVRQVYNDLQIGDDSLVDPARDRWITTKLRGRVLADAGIFDVNYSITTVAGTIHLIGVAQDQAEIDRVVAHASDIAQVRRILVWRNSYWHYWILSQIF